MNSEDKENYSFTIDIKSPQKQESFLIQQLRLKRESAKINIKNAENVTNRVLQTIDPNQIANKTQELSPNSKIRNLVQHA